MDFVDSGSGSLEVNDVSVHLREMERHMLELQREEAKNIETKVDAVVEALEREDVDELWPGAPDDLSAALDQIASSSPTQRLVSAALELDFDEGSGRARYENVFGSDEEEESAAGALGDICTLLQAAGESGIDLNRWLTHYDRTGTGVLKKTDLRKAVTSLGLGVHADGEIMAERALEVDAFNALVDHLGGRRDVDVVPYARLLTMVPSMGVPKRSQDSSPTNSPSQASPKSASRSSKTRNAPPKSESQDLARVANPGQSPHAKALAKQSAHRKDRVAQEVKALQALPPDMRATIGQNRARERVRKRAAAERSAARKSEILALQKTARAEKKLCDAVSLTAKMQRVTARRRKKKEDKKAKARAMQLAMQDSSTLEDLIRSRLSSRTAFGTFLKALKVRNHAGLITHRKSISGKVVARIVRECTGLDLPRSAVEKIMLGAEKCMREDPEWQKAQPVRDSEIGQKETAKKWSMSTKCPIAYVEKNFRRIRCKTRIAYSKWTHSKGAAASVALKRLSSTIEQALGGDIEALQNIQQDVLCLEKSAKHALGEVEGECGGALGAAINDPSLSISEGAAEGNGQPLERKTTRVRRELRQRKILPMWQVKAAAEDITDKWLSSLEGRAAVRHAAWAQSNAGRALDKAVEPDEGALAAAGAKIHEERLSQLVDSAEGAVNEKSSATPSSGGPGAFYEMLSHKLFGEFLREMIFNANEWLKQNPRNSLKSWPKRPFDEWMQRRNEQTLRNKETVAQWQRHKKAQFAQSHICRVAIVDEVVQCLRELEQMSYREVSDEKLGKTRKAARMGLNIDKCLYEIRKIGKENSAQVAPKPSGRGRGRHSKKSAAKKALKSADWITFRQFLRVMEQRLFSLKAYPPTAKLANALLCGEVGDGKLLFVVNREPIGSVPSIALEQSDKLKKEHNQRIKAYKKWKLQKAALRKKEARLLAMTQAKEKERKSKLKRESAKAVKQWKKIVDQRKPPNPFMPRAAWADVYTAPEETEEWSSTRM